MKKVIMLIFMICHSLWLSSQETMKVFLKDNNIPISIYFGQLGDKIKYTIMGDTIFENYYSFSIMNENEIMFYVKVQSVSQYNSPVIEGWVDKKHCGTYLRCDADEANQIRLYESPDLNNKFKAIMGDVSFPVTVIGVYKGWLKIILEKDHEVYVGWVNSFCSNVYNSCS